METKQENIVRTDYSEIMQKSYIDYAMSVIISRALPDVRDGLKPVQRRTLYDMYELGIRYDRPYRKCARIVGDTMGKYHPHGDSSIYEALVVMAQEFKKGKTLVDGHGNFGSIEGDGAAAMRYTEARLEKLTQEVFLEDLDKNVVDFVPNFDETEKEPSVLPVKIPNLLVNGAEGIAVGMATSIPPHNLGEVIDAVKAYMKDNQISVRGLMRYIKGPDFPTGGIVVNKDDLCKIYETGTGKLRIRGRVTTEKLKGGKKQLVITEIPYTMLGANIGKFLNDVASLVETKKTTDIVDISNQSSKEGIRIVLELKKDTDVENLTNMLYKKTRLEDTFGVNMLAVADGRPETLSLKQVIEHHVDFLFEVTTRKYKTLLGRELEKQEVQEGLIKACDVIDLIIEILRGSKNREQVKKCLVEGNTEGIRFKTKTSEKAAKKLQFTEKQATAILDMRLYKLIGLEIEALQAEYEQTMKNIALYKDILDHYDSMAEVIIKELDAIKKEYSTKRRTSIENAEEAVYEEKKMEETEVCFLMDRFGYMKLIDKNAYERNKEAACSENRYVFTCMNTDKILFFFQRSVKTGRTNLHDIAVLNKIILIKSVAELPADCLTVIYRNAARLVNVASQVPVSCFLHILHIHKLESCFLHNGSKKGFCLLFVFFSSAHVFHLPFAHTDAGSHTVISRWVITFAKRVDRSPLLCYPLSCYNYHSTFHKEKQGLISDSRSDPFCITLCKAHFVQYIRSVTEGDRILLMASQKVGMLQMISLCQPHSSDSDRGLFHSGNLLL